jgi:uncharacterized membrane protein YdjX (TVP38/TMEM64 family)
MRFLLAVLLTVLFIVGEDLLPRSIQTLIEAATFGYVAGQLAAWVANRVR